MKGVTVERARVHKPNIAGCRLYVDESRHHRWIITYHCSGKTKGPWSTSALYNPDVRAALMHCLRWVWAQHEQYVHPGEVPMGRGMMKRACCATSRAHASDSVQHAPVKWWTSCSQGIV